MYVIKRTLDLGDTDNKHDVEMLITNSTWSDSHFNISIQACSLLALCILMISFMSFWARSSSFHLQPENRKQVSPKWQPPWYTRVLWCLASCHSYTPGYPTIGIVMEHKSASSIQQNQTSAWILHPGGKCKHTNVNGNLFVALHSKTSALTDRASNRRVCQL